MLLCICFIMDHGRCKIVVFKNISDTHVMTFMSGCSPRGTGTALLHKGQTGT